MYMDTSNKIVTVTVATILSLVILGLVFTIVGDNPINIAWQFIVRLCQATCGS